MPTLTVTYNNNNILSTSTNNTYTLSCNGKKMASDITITTDNAGLLTVTYNTTTIVNMSGSGTRVLSCNGKKMASDVVITLSDAPSLQAPTISITSDTLEITDNDENTESFDIYVDGVWAANVPKAAPTSTFSIDNVEYEFEDGMTWVQWCNSAYNTDGCYILNGGVYRANAIDSHLRSYSTNDNVSSTDTIVEDGHYYWSSGGSND